MRIRINVSIDSRTVADLKALAKLRAKRERFEAIERTSDAAVREWRFSERPTRAFAAAIDQLAEALTPIKPPPPEAA